MIVNQTDGLSSESLQTLRRVFSEQYQIEDDTVTARPKEAISAASVQSPHDTDCHYRKKDDHKVKGYSINVTETCDTDRPLNLITNVLVDTATAADCDFVQSAVEATREVVLQKTESINADGAYHSVSNQDYCRENGIDLTVSAIQGKTSRYDLKMDEDEQLIVTDLTTNTEVAVREVKPRQEGAQPKWCIKTEDGKNRYFTQKEIDTCSLRRQIAQRPMEELNRRNNVEATIFQLGYHYPNAKSRYRGLIKHKMWANARCLWVNFVRIMNFIAAGGSKCVQNVKNRLFLPKIMLINVNFQYFMHPVKNFSPRFSVNRLRMVF